VLIAAIKSALALWPTLLLTLAVKVVDIIRRYASLC